MAFQGLKRVLAVVVLGGIAAGVIPSACGQEEVRRKLKSKVVPEYPDLARRHNIVGVVKIQITVAANGTVKNAKVIGGNPLLVDNALDAVKQWRYEPAKEETNGLVEFHFGGNQ